MSGFPAASQTGARKHDAGWHTPGKYRRRDPGRATPETVKKLRAAAYQRRDRKPARLRARTSPTPLIGEVGADIVEHAQALGADVVSKIHLLPRSQEIRHLQRGVER